MHNSFTVFLSHNTYYFILPFKTCAWCLLVLEENLQCFTFVFKVEHDLDSAFFAYTISYHPPRLTKLQPDSPPLCVFNLESFFLPLALCTSYSLCLVNSSLGFYWLPLLHIFGFSLNTSFSENPFLISYAKYVLCIIMPCLTALITIRNNPAKICLVAHDISPQPKCRL